MLRSARSRYLLAAALWATSVAWLLVDPAVRGVYPLLVAMAAVTATVCAAALERDERTQQVIRLAWWAGSVHPMAGTLPAQREATRVDAN